MGEVVSLEQAREERMPHSEGKARCIACGHEHRSVAPVGVVWQECPACHTMKALFVGNCEIEGQHWHCECGNFLFQWHETHGLYCPNCGLVQA